VRFEERGHRVSKTVGTLKSSEHAKSNLGIVALRTASTTTCLLFLLALSSCVSLSERVVDLTKGSYFAQALLAIQKEELRVQEAPDKKSLDELAKARSAFAEAVEGEFLPRISAEISQGKTYSAHKIATEGLGLCAWSNHLGEIDRTLSQTILAIEVVESRWATILQSGVLPTDQIIQLKKDLYAIKGSISDADGARKLNRILQEAIFGRAIAAIETTRLKVSASDFEAIKSDVASVETDKGNENSVSSLLDLAFRLSNQPVTAGVDPAWKKLYSVSLSPAEADINSRLTGVLQDCFENWAVKELLATLAQNGGLPELLDQAEVLLLENSSLRKSSEFLSLLASSHFKRAVQLNHGGIGSIIAKIHLGRTSVGDINQQVVKDELSKADAFLTKSVFPKYYLNFTINPKIPLDIQDTVFSNYFADFLSHSRKGAPWTFDPAIGVSRVRVTIDDGELVFPKTGDLKERFSSYLDHYDNVNNPYKDSLKWDLDWKKSSIDRAESSYNWAVSSYNISPSDFALNQVNYAYRAYKQAINDYNYAVDTYNNTPSLIKQPAYLSYSYKEGYWSLGYSLRVTIEVDDTKKTLSARSVDTGLVRIGTKYNDINENSRVDVPWKYDMSVSGFLSHVSSVNREIDNGVFDILSSVNVPTIESISVAETAAAKAVLHPWGVDLSRYGNGRVSKWMLPLLVSAGPQDAKLEIPVQQLVLSKIAKSKFTGAQSLVAAVGGTVVLIENYDNSQLYSTGSGALVGANGLIITCAHVLNTSDLRVVVLENGKAVEYPAEVVFTNQQNDVALIKVPKLKNTVWANVRLTNETAKGERIVAIGNPSLGGGLLNTNGVTQGIVSNPLLEDGALTRIVGDITIASGSSGGPIFSLETGELVGVVQAVTQSGLNNSGVSSSGSFALGAPSQLLGSWLGLKY
jgi:hypothetical protein